MAGMGMGLGCKTMVIFCDRMRCSTVHTVNMLFYWCRVFLVVVVGLEICPMPGIKYGPKKWFVQFTWLCYCCQEPHIVVCWVG
jgi:hypothetical protein